MASQITGATFNLIKKVESTGETPTAERPADDNTPSPGVPGEGSTWRTRLGTIKDSVGVQSFIDVAKHTISETLSVVSGSSQLQDQIGALQQVTGQTLATVGAFAVNPIAGIAAVAMQGVTAYFKNVEFSQSKAWSEYDRAEYNAARGGAYTLYYNRSRHNG